MCGKDDLSLLYDVVPRSRRAEHRDWNNCRIGAAMLNDKAICNERARGAGIKVPTQVSLDGSIVVRSTNRSNLLEFSHPAVTPNTLWMLKDRQGLQGDAVWAGKACTPLVARELGDDVLARMLEHLGRSGRLVAEEFLRPERYFSDAGDTALPTVRVVTSKLGTTTAVVGLVLFRGASGSLTSHRKHGGKLYVINDSGACSEGLDKFGKRWEACGFEFSSPQLDDIRVMCLRAHELFSCVGSIGWDVGISNQGMFLLEGNPNWGMNVPQLLPGRSMLQDFTSSRFRDTWTISRIRRR
ncbi:sugar-transfer associated ATP-grasp domain-containing protein [Herbidospora mongoliensis]|uniref:sugar-transfer associated ATP-grasp domain-containing protein n=1 Tax=Herbidospora mongoliensis TaxID=688067 RepID=UPI0034E21F4A